MYVALILCKENGDNNWLNNLIYGGGNKKNNQHGFGIKMLKSPDIVINNNIDQLESQNADSVVNWYELGLISAYAPHWKKHCLGNI